jgi:hypothetical protein
MEPTMLTRYYRPIVVGCALSWFLLGLHLPTLHELAHHRAAPHWTVLAMVAFLALMAVAALWALLRAPSRGTA